MTAYLLKEYIREILLLQEAKIDDVKAKYPSLASLIDTNFSALQPKYLEWSAKMLSQDPVQDVAETIGELISNFDELLNKNQIQGSQRDINAFKSVDDLSSLLSSFEGKETKRTEKLGKFRQERTQAVKDSIPIFEDDKVFIVVPLTQEASCFYGAKWCISSKEAYNYWDYYTLSQDNGFVFIIDKAEGGKYALVIDENGYIEEVRDTEDALVDEQIIDDYFASYKDQIDKAIDKASETPEFAYNKKEKYFEGLEKYLLDLDPKIDFKFNTKTGEVSVKYDKKLQSYKDTKTGEWMPARIYSDGVKEWRNKGLLQSFQDPVTGEWMPALIHPNGTKLWYDKDQMQSFQNPVTGEWMPARISDDGSKRWFDKNDLQSFQDPKTQEWMPAITYPDGTKYWFDKENRVRNPETYDWRT